MPKVKPGLDDSHLASPQSPEERAGATAPPQHPVHDPYRAPSGQSPYRPPPGQMPYAPLPVPQTPDGQRLSGWWRRVGALVIDNILVMVVAIVVTLPWFSDWWASYQHWVDDLMTAAQQQTQRPAIPTSELAFPWQTMVVDLVLYAAYEITLVARRGQTVGKMATGIRIRQAGQDQLLSLRDSAVRFVVKQVRIIAAPIPFLGSLAVIFTVVDYLAPLFDRMKQALHDRAAHSYVVRSGDPRPR